MQVNGKQDKLISIRDRGLLYGDGVFRTFLAAKGKVKLWSLHYQKLQHDCSRLSLSCPLEALLTEQLSQLLKQHSDGVVKLIITRGGGERGYTPSQHAEATIIWDVAPAPLYPADWASHGIKMRLCQLRLSHQPRLAGIKHLNRLENVLAAAEWDDAEIGEGLLLDADNNVIEGTRSNLFLLQQGQLITPELSRCGVAGVQRERVMAWATQHRVPLQVRDVALDEVLKADELFLVNSIVGLWSIREFEQRRWTAFQLATRIRQDFDRDAA